jgi:hypothetical protein
MAIQAMANPMPMGLGRRRTIQEEVVCNRFANEPADPICAKTSRTLSVRNRLKRKDLLAERVGFEPTVRLPVQRFSSSKILMLARVTL